MSLRCRRLVGMTAGSKMVELVEETEDDHSLRWFAWSQPDLGRGSGSCGEERLLVRLAENEDGGQICKDAVAASGWLGLSSGYVCNALSVNMVVTVKQMALIVSFFGILSFILGVVAENKKPVSGTPITDKDGVTCKYLANLRVALGFLSIAFLITSTVVGYLSLFYSYQRKSVPQRVLFKSTSFMIFFNIALSDASAELKIYRAFIFSVPIFFTFILLFLFYLFYLRPRRVYWSSLRMRSFAVAQDNNNDAISTFDLGLKKELREMLPIIVYKESFSVKDTQYKEFEIATHLKQP